MMDVQALPEQDPRANYIQVLALYTTDELGQMLIASVKLKDTEFVDALREEIKHRKQPDNINPPPG